MIFVHPLKSKIKCSIPFLDQTKNFVLKLLTFVEEKSKSSRAQTDKINFYFSYINNNSLYKVAKKKRFLEDGNFLNQNFRNIFYFCSKFQSKFYATKFSFLIMKLFQFKSMCCNTVNYHKITIIQTHFLSSLNLLIQRQKLV